MRRESGRVARNRRGSAPREGRPLEVEFEARLAGVNAVQADARKDRQDLLLKKVVKQNLNSYKRPREMPHLVSYHKSSKAS